MRLGRRAMEKAAMGSFIVVPPYGAVKGIRERDRCRDWGIEV
jgi:hypothetical protein